MTFCGLREAVCSLPPQARGGEVPMFPDDYRAWMQSMCWELTEDLQHLEFGHPCNRFSFYKVGLGAEKFGNHQFQEFVMLRLCLHTKPTAALPVY